VKGTQWELGAVGNAEWTGVSLGELLRQAGVKSGAIEVILEGADSGAIDVPNSQAGEKQLNPRPPIDESMDRLDLNVSIDNPIEHCMFNLDAVTRVLHESKLASLHIDVQKEAKHARNKLKAVQAEAQNAVGEKKPDPKKIAEVVKKLDDIHASILAMRDSIATRVPAP
jgi:hypothetical protein